MTYYTAEEALEDLNNILNEMDESESAFIAKYGRRTVEADKSLQRIASDERIYKIMETLDNFFEYAKFSELEKWGGWSAVRTLAGFFEEMRTREGQADGQLVDSALTIIREALERYPNIQLAGGREPWEENWHRNSSVTGIPYSM